MTLRYRQNDALFGWMLPPARVVALLFLLLAGCFGGSDHPALHPVSGELFVKGQPAAGARIIFHPAENADPNQWKMGYPSAIVQPDGKFHLRSFEKNGVPAGSYKVVATWSEGDTDLPNEDEDAPPPKQLIDPQYATPDSTPWSVVVESKRNELARFEVN